MTYQPTGSLGAMIAAMHTKVVKPEAAKQALYTHIEKPETMDQKYGRIPRFTCRRKPVYPEKNYQGRYGISKANLHTTTD